MSHSPPPIFADIEAAMGRGDVPAALDLSRQAIDQGLSHPILFKLRASWHEGEGRPAEACADLERALALAPGNPALLTSLGRCAAAAGRFGLSANAFAQVVAADPALAAAHYNLGFAREQLGELDAAWAAYSRAAELDPALDDALARLAGLASRRGDGAQARRFAEQALAINPRSVTAAFALIVADLAEGRFAEAQARALSVASAADVVPQARAHALSFAADAADGQDRTADAFALYRQANDALKTLYRPHFEGRETGTPLAQRLAGEFAAIARQAWTPWQPVAACDGEAAGLVFLLGFPRSGTTLLGQILGCHPDVVTIEEKPLLREALHAFIDTPGGLARLAALPAQEIARCRAQFWRHVKAQVASTQGKTVVDQSPLDTLHLPVIAKLFPESRIVFALRDPRDVVLSCFRRLFAINGYLYEFLSLDGTARFYDAAMRLADAYRATLALPWHDVRNEDVVADFDAGIRALCDHVGLDWNDSLRDFADRARASRIATPSAVQVVRGIKDDGIGRWKAYEKELAPIAPIVSPWVERFGYA